MSKLSSTNKFQRFIKGVKENPRVFLLYYVIPAVLLIGIIISLVVLLKPSPADDEVIEESSSSTSSVSSVQSSSSKPVETAEVLPVLTKEQMEEFKATAKKNPDAKAWLNIPDTKINFPVMQKPGDQNAADYYYLKYNVDKALDIRGSITASHKANLESFDKMVRNTVIYGHNLTETTKPELLNEHFGDLLKLKDLEFAKKHKYVTLTIGDKTQTYVIFSAMDTEVEFYYIDASPEDKAYEDMLAQAKDRSYLDFDVDVNKNDKILTLSTCTGEYRYGPELAVYNRSEECRFVIMARPLRDGEKLSDIKEPTVNKDRREPKISKQTKKYELVDGKWKLIAKQ